MGWGGSDEHTRSGTHRYARLAAVVSVVIIIIIIVVSVTAVVSAVSAVSAVLAVVFVFVAAAAAVGIVVVAMSRGRRPHTLAAAGSGDAANSDRNVTRAVTPNTLLLIGTPNASAGGTWGVGGGRG